MLRIAIPSDGAIHCEIVGLFSKIGVGFPDYKQDAVIVRSTDFPAEFLLVHQCNIPELVSAGMADAGICYSHIAEQNLFPEEQQIKSLGLPSVELAVSVLKDVKYKGLEWLMGKDVATPYPHLFEKYLRGSNVRANVCSISEHAEMALELGLADAVFDIVPTGAKQINSRLKQVDSVLISNAVVIVAKQLKPQAQLILDEIFGRIDTVTAVRGKKFVSMSVPTAAIDTVREILPPFQCVCSNGDTANVIVVMEEKRLWDIVEKLKNLGVENIVVCPINNIIS